MVVKQYVNYNGISIYDEEIKAYIKKNGYDLVTLTKSEYDALPTSEKMGERKFYYIADMAQTDTTTKFEELSDVSFSNLSNGQVPVYDFDSSKWINGEVASGPVVLSADIAANATTLSFTDDAIGDNTRFDVYTSVYGVNPTDMAQSSTTLTLTFPSSHDAATIQVHCWNT